MANSRTKILIPMLALCMFAVTAYGQAVLVLGSNPTRVRIEGLTEVVGLITLSNNTNAAQVIPGGTTIAVVYDGTITNVPGISTTAVGAVPDKNVYTTGVTAPGNSSGVLGPNGATVTPSGASLTISVPAAFVNNGTGVCAAGTPPATANTLCLVPGGSLNIQGVRVAIAGLPAGNVNATLTTVPQNAITFPGGINQTVVGRAQATIGAVNVVNAPTLGQCAIFPSPTLGSTGTISSGALPGGGFSGLNPLSNGFWVNVTEPQTFPTSFSAATSATNIAGVITPNAGAPYFFDEAGITPAGFQGTSPVPTRGVQFVLGFASLPAGLTLIAQQGPAATGGLTPAGTTPATGIALGGQFTIQSVTSTGALSTGLAGNFLALTSSGGAATVTYEVIGTGTSAASASPTTVDTVSIPFLITAPAGTAIPVGSLGTVAVSVAPVSSSTATSGNSLRFAANSGVPATPIAIGAVAPCLTNLLFPFVSNRTGTTFNTGLAISNTANDATFGTKTATTGQTGGVTLWFFGVSAPTGGTAGIALPIPAVSTGGTVATAGVIAPGEHTAFVLNDGSTKAVAPGFQGYVIALCAFQYAHGLATIFDNFGIGPANVGFSYLPLVLNGTSTAGLRSVGGNNGASATLSAGPEVLAH